MFGTTSKWPPRTRATDRPRTRQRATRTSAESASCSRAPARCGRPRADTGSAPRASIVCIGSQPSVDTRKFSVDTGKYSRRRLDVKPLAIQKSIMAAGGQDRTHMSLSKTTAPLIGHKSLKETEKDWLTRNCALNRKLGKFFA